MAEFMDENRQRKEKDDQQGWVNFGGDDLRQ
jgi:hypothetical protein